MMIGLTGDGETEPPPLRRSTRSKKNLEQSSPASQASTTTPVSASSKGGRGRPRIVPSSSPKGQKEKKNLQQAPEAEEDDRNLSSESSDGDSGSDTYEDAQGYNTTRSSITHAAGRGRGGRGGRSTSTRSRDADMSSATKEAHGRSIKSRKPSGASRGRKRVSAELDDGLNGSDDVSDASESVPSRKGNTSGRNHSKRTRISGNYIPVLVFEAVTAKNAALQTLVGEWQESYELYPAEAFEEMINFLLESCGCPEPVNKDALDDPDLIGDALQVLQNQFEEASLGQYPILSKTKKPNAPVRRSLQDFWSRWVANLRGNLLFEEDEEAGSVLDDLKTWLITMSSSPFKPFRHTSTFITLVIMTALCEMLKTVTLEWSTINRQVEAQIRKGSSAASGRQKELKDKADNLSSNKAKVESHIQDLFNSLFMHRYRDSDPNIRAECIRELGVWTSLAPEIFLDPQYLRYLGWMLFDNVGSVRMESVKALLTLYSSKTEGFVSGLRPFTERFKSRLLDMAAREVDPAVRTTAAKVVIQVAMSNLLYDNERDKVLLLLFDADPQSRELVAEFAISVWKEDYLQPRCQDLGRLAFIGGNGNESMDLGDNLDIQTVDPKLQLKALCVMLTHLMKELAERNRKKFSVSNSTVEALTEAAKSIHRGPSYAQNPSRSVGSLGSQGSLAYSQSLGQNGSQVTDENFILLADVEAIDDDSDGEDISMEDKSGVEETEIGHKSVSKEKESIPDEWGGAELLPERGDGDVEELSEWVSRLGEENISQISGSERAEVQFVPILGVSDVLWDRLDVVKNWQQMFEYLIDDFHEPNYSQESQESQSLDLESTRRATLRPTRGEEICLLYLLSSALSRTLKAPEHFDLTVALGGENEKISVGKKKQKKAAEKGSAVDIADVKLEVSRHIIRYIPKLLQKYSAEQVLGGEYTKEVYNYSCERLREALRFISLIDIGIYVELRMAKAYDTLIDELRKIFIRQANRGIVHDCVDVFLHLCGGSFVESESENNKQSNDLADGAVSTEKSTRGLKARSMLTQSEGEVARSSATTGSLHTATREKVLEIVDAVLNEQVLTAMGELQAVCEEADELLERIADGVEMNDPLPSMVLDMGKLHSMKNAMVRFDRLSVAVNISEIADLSKLKPADDIEESSGDLYQLLNEILELGLNVSSYCTKLGQLGKQGWNDDIVEARRVSHGLMELVMENMERAVLWDLKETFRRAKKLESNSDSEINTDARAGSTEEDSNRETARREFKERLKSFKARALRLVKIAEAFLVGADDYQFGLDLRVSAMRVICDMYVVMHGEASVVLDLSLARAPAEDVQMLCGAVLERMAATLTLEMKGRIQAASFGGRRRSDRLRDISDLIVSTRRKRGEDQDEDVPILYISPELMLISPERAHEAALNLMHVANALKRLVDHRVLSEDCGIPETLLQFHGLGKLLEHETSTEIRRYALVADQFKKASEELAKLPPQKSKAAARESLTHQLLGLGKEAKLLLRQLRIRKAVILAGDQSEGIKLANVSETGGCDMGQLLPSLSGSVLEGAMWDQLAEEVGRDVLVRGMSDAISSAIIAWEKSVETHVDVKGKGVAVEGDEQKKRNGPQLTAQVKGEIVGKFEERLQKMASVVVRSIEKSVSLFLDGYVGSLDATMGLLKHLVPLLKSWGASITEFQSRRQSGSLTKMNEVVVAPVPLSDSEVFEIFSMLAPCVVNCVERIMKRGVERLITNALVPALNAARAKRERIKKLKALRRGSLISMMSENDFDEDDEGGSPKARISVGAANSAWKVWALVGTAAKFVLSTIDTYEKSKSKHAPTRTLRSVVEFAENCLSEHGIKPDVDDADWSPFYAFVKAVETGIADKKGGMRVAGESKRGRPAKRGRGGKAIGTGAENKTAAARWRKRKSDADGENEPGAGQQIQKKKRERPKKQRLLDDEPEIDGNEYEENDDGMEDESPRQPSRRSQRVSTGRQPKAYREVDNSDIDEDDSEAEALTSKWKQKRTTPNAEMTSGKKSATATVSVSPAKPLAKSGDALRGDRISFSPKRLVSSRAARAAERTPRTYGLRKKASTTVHDAVSSTNSDDELPEPMDVEYADDGEVRNHEVSSTTLYVRKRWQTSPFVLPPKLRHVIKSTNAQSSWQIPEIDKEAETDKSVCEIEEESNDDQNESEEEHNQEEEQEEEDEGFEDSPEMPIPTRRFRL